MPYADNGLIPVPSSNTSDPLLEYLFLSDIFPTAWQALDYSGFEPGDTVAVFGAGPVGLLSAYSAMLRGASRVYSVDSVPARLSLAASIGAIPIAFNESDPVQQILAHEPGGVRRSVDCVGYEAVNASLSPESDIVLRNMIEVTSVNGGVGVAGVYPSTVYSDEGGRPDAFTVSVGDLWTKALRLGSGAVNPMTLAGKLVDLISSGKANPNFIISSEVSIEEAPEAYRRFNEHLETKVVFRFP